MMVILNKTALNVKVYFHLEFIIKLIVCDYNCLTCDTL